MSALTPAPSPRVRPLKAAPLTPAPPSSPAAARNGRRTAIVVALALLSAILGVLAADPAVAGPAPVMTGYVPLSADDFAGYLGSIGSPDATLDFTVGITNAAAGAVIYYDHREDGFESDLANPGQATTEVFGNGNAGDGDAGAYCDVCGGDLLPQGAALIMRNAIATPRTSDIRFDGGDKVASTRGIAITAGGFTTPTGSVLSGVVSAYDTTKYGTQYTVPVGEDTPFPAGTTDAFSYTGASIMAANPGTLVEVDTDGDGDVDTAVTLGEGISTLVDGGLLEGATVRSSAPVQMHLLTGRRGSTFEARSFTLFPDEVLSNDYMSPAGSSVENYRTVNYLYNPGASDLVVTPTCTGCSGTVTVPAQASAAFHSPAGEAVRFTSAGGTFVAIAGVGAQSGAAPGGGANQSQTWDWGFSMIPTSQLTTQVVLGWAPGNSNNPPTAAQATYDPVWVTTLSATTVHVDYDGNPATGAIVSSDCFGARHDVDIAVTALASTRISEAADGDMTGARIYTCDGTRLAGAWGEDPSVASAGAPGFDAGYTIIPSTTMVVDKSASLVSDVDGDGAFGPGDSMTYEIAIADAGSLAFTDVVVADVLPAGLTYAPGTTRLVTDGGTTPIADDAVPPAATAFPLDDVGVSLPDIAAGETVYLRFDVAITEPWSLATSDIGNTACVTAAEATACDTSQTVLATADLSLTKTETASPAFVGDDAVFLVTVTNGGSDLAPGVEVTDLLPSGLALVSATASQGTYDDVTGLWAVGDLSPAGSATLQITATVEVESAVTNVAQVTRSGAADPDSQPAENPLGAGNPPDQDDEAAVSVDVAPRVIDLSVDQSVTPPSFVGQDAVFQITVTNAGPVAATGVAVTDLLPAGLTYVSSSATVGTYDPDTGVWSVGSLAVSASATLTLTATLEVVGPVVNTAEVTAADQPDVDSTPDNGLAGEDDLDTAGVSAEGAAIGDRVWDDVDADGVQDAGEPGLDGVTVTLLRDGDGDDTYETTVTTTTTGGGGAYQLADLGPGRYRIVFDATTVPAGYVPTTASTVTLVLAPGEVVDDADGGFSSAADLMVAKELVSAPTFAGEEATFLITVTNLGPAAATGVVVEDALPAGLSFVSATATQGSFAGDLWTVGSLALDGEAALTLVARVDTADPVTNTAEISAADQHDPDSTPGDGAPGDDDLASATVDADPLVDLELVVGADASAVFVGQPATLTVTVTNQGPSPATGVVVRDVLPAGLTFVNAAPSVGSFDPDTGLWTLGDLDIGASATLELVVTVTAPGPSTDVAEVHAVDQPDVDSTPANGNPEEDDRSSVELTGVQIDLSLTKTVDDAEAVVGDSVTYTLTVANSGPSAATGVVVRDELPAGLEWISDTSGGRYDAVTGQWMVGTVEPGESVSIAITAKVRTAGALANHAAIDKADQPDADSAPGNSVAGEDDEGTAVVTVAPSSVGGLLVLTGAEVRTMIGAAIALLLLGASMVQVVRRRRPHGA